MTSLLFRRARSRAVNAALRPPLGRAGAPLAAATLLTALALTTLALAPSARAICRVVESEDSPPVSFDATTSAFFVVVDEVVIDYRCPEDEDELRWASDRAGQELEGALAASLPRHLPASHLPPLEAIGHEPPHPLTDAGSPDAGTPRRCRDGSAATEIVSPLVSLVLQPRVTGGGGHAGLVMPVAARPDVALGPDDAFGELARTATALATRVHETVIVTEDPSLGFQCTDPHYTSALERSASDEVLASVAAAPLALYGCGAADGAPYYRPGTGRRDTREIDYGDAGTVQYEAIPVSDAYSVTVLSASSMEALVLWMDENGFAHDATDDEAFGAYVGEGRWFVALDVHPPDTLEATELGVTGLAPLVVSWPGNEIPIQNRLQFDPDGGTVVTDAYVLSAQRVDAEDGSALTIASGAAHLEGPLASFGLDTGVLTQLRLARQQHLEAEDSRIVPIVGTAPAAPTTVVERTTRVRIPLACCEGGGVASSSAPPRTYTYEREWDEALGAPAIPEPWFRTPEHASSEAFCRNAGGGGGGRGYYCAVASFPVSGFGPILFAIGWLAFRGLRRRSARS
jgi:hypothetical protein